MRTRAAMWAWLGAAAVAGGGSIGCNLISGLADLKIDETGSTGPTGGGGTGGTGDTGGTGGSGGTVTGGTGGTATGGTGGTGGASSCSDGQTNGQETDTDCGGPDCPRCDAGRACVVSTDCKTEICSGPDGAEKCVKATHLAVGSAHACAVLDSQELYCWGANDTGQLGTSAVTESAVPVKVALEKVMAVTAGGLPGTSSAHTCALDAGNQVYCWGANDAGQLGQGNTTPSADPTLVMTLAQVVGVAAGGAFTCAHTQLNQAFCWGANESGQIGDGGGAAILAPVPVPTIGATTGVATGARHACALLMNDTLWCWGDNTRGQTADNPPVGVTKPALVQGLSAVKSVAAGQDFTCARNAADLLCWGDNTDMQLTDAVVADHVTSPALTSIAGVTDVALGADGELDSGENAPVGGHACALLDTGKVTCWGNDRSGQLGRGTISMALEEGEPQEIEGLDSVVVIAAGTEVSCAILDTGAVRCWGKNDRGQLGAGSTGGAQSSPVAVAWP